ncbi:MAG: metal-dependent transcriptional regulator [Verrucomicrobiales bacterium]
MAKAALRMATSTVENYLKSLLHIADANEGRVTVGAIAEDLKVTPGTVSTMMKHLSAEGYVDYQPRRQVNLTEKGRRQALLVVRRHRLIETFLVEVMELDWGEVHEEAEILEHVISDRLLDKMDDMLGHPSADPHGDPIPDRHGRLVASRAHALSAVSPGSYRLVRVSNEDPIFLHWLSANGLMPGCELRLLQRQESAGISELHVTGQAKPLQLGREAEAAIFVESL